MQTDKKKKNYASGKKGKDEFEWVLTKVVYIANHEINYVKVENERQIKTFTMGYARSLRFETKLTNVWKWKWTGKSIIMNESYE